MNILSFDIEEWFHLLDCDDTRSEEQWKHYEVRIHDNVSRILDILDQTNTRATFFVIGWVARTYPEVVRRIAEKYQVGCHTMNHQLVWQQSPQEFHDDVEAGVKLLQDITGQPVEVFRAPGFSIRESEAWAFETLGELGIKYDSSVFPAAHAHGGMPSFSTQGPAIVCHAGARLKEFPISFKPIMGKHIVFSGGGYFRLFPYSLIKRWSRQSGDYLLSYLHPRDLDPGQPMIKSLPLARKFKSYVGLRQAEQKLRKWLRDFDFVDIHQANDLIDWSQVPVYQL
ncbi:MAG: polysaccharide deacetylase family protein [Muribaculaceae bacterium]|nr:polysaccharide deacetylase family protein [Muribaculaceae bacterium]